MTKTIVPDDQRLSELLPPDSWLRMRLEGDGLKLASDLRRIDQVDLFVMMLTAQTIDDQSRRFTEKMRADPHFQRAAAVLRPLIRPSVRKEMGWVE